MTITSAILEFLVIGCLWVSALLFCAFAATALALGYWPNFDFGWASITASLLGIPLAYAVGVVFQASTWVLWYKRIHRKALDKEMQSNHKVTYQRLANDMRKRGLHVGLPENELETGVQLGGLLDALRWELMASSRTEPAAQYLIQFHLYRILYGSIPPFVLIAFGLVVAGVAAWRIDTNWLWIGPITLAALFLGMAYLAQKGAEHRRSRTWKYLVFGVQSLAADRKASL